MEIEEYEKENLNKNKEENEKRITLIDKIKKKIEDNIIPILLTLIPLVIDSFSKRAKASYYGYPIDFFETDYSNVIFLVIIIIYFIFLAVGFRKLKMFKDIKNAMLIMNLLTSFILTIFIMPVLFVWAAYLEIEETIYKFSHYFYFFGIYLITLIGLSEKEDFLIFKNKIILYLIKFFKNVIVQFFCRFILIVFFAGFIVSQSPEFQSEYMIFKDEYGNEKAVVSIKGNEYKYSNCKIEKIGTYKNGNPKYKLIIYTNVKESISQNDTKPKTIYFHEVEINKNEGKPKQQVNCIAVKQ